MSITRTQVLEKLQVFLGKKITQEEVSQWALALAVADSYEDITANDPLLKETIQALIDINHPHAAYVPTEVDLFYYKQCLEGEKDFEPLQERLEKEEKKDGSKSQRQAKKKREIYLLIRRYIILFAFVAMGVNLFTMFNPEFFQLRFDRPTASLAYKEMFLHLMYSIFLLWPSRLLAKTAALYQIALFVFCIGAIYYWGETVAMVLKMGLHPLMIFVISPFTGIPALLAIFLLKEDRNKVTGETERLL